MEKKKKQVYKLIYREEFMRIRIVWILFLFSIFLVLFVKFALSFHLTDDTFWKSMLEILYDIVLSVVAATIFYVLTDFYPNTEKKIVQKISIANSLYLFKDEVANVRSNFNAKDVGRVFSDKEFFEYYLKDDVSSFSFDDKVSPKELHTLVHFKHDKLLHLNDMISNIEATFKDLVSVSLFMEDGDMCIINNVFYCSLFAEIRRKSNFPFDDNERNMEINFGLLKSAYYELKFWEEGLKQLYGRYSKYVTLTRGGISLTQ